MKTWKIPVIWGMKGFVSVNAPTLREAIVIAQDKESNIPLPRDGSYLEDSWEIDCTEDPEYVRQCFNENQKDEAVMPTLEAVLRQQFNCEKPFLDGPYYDECERAPMTLTDEGSKAYDKLINLVYTLGNLTGCNVNQMVDQLDRIASEL